jgi:glycosyltransferase domain-containing protein
MVSPRSRYTLLVPTFNRPAELRSLLGYLAARRFRYPVRVLDSSSGEALSLNRETVARAELDAVRETYDPALSVHDKITLALADVNSAYCSLCADDDVLFTERLDELLGVLDADPTLVIAHGYYVNFRPGRDLELWNTDYSTPSVIADDALRRIVRQMSSYQALFYGIHRTSTMIASRRSLDRVKSLWAKELLTSSLTLIEGGAYRAPYYYMARSSGPSVTGDGWHPHHFFATEPAALLREYVDYRAATLERLALDAACRAGYPKEQMERVLDLAHVKYLATMLAPDVLDYLIRETLRGQSTSRQLMDGMWRSSTPAAERATAGLPRQLARTRRLLHPTAAAADGYYFWRLAGCLGGLKLREKLDASLGPSGDRLTVRRTTRDGRPRSYTMTRALLTQKFADGGRVTAPHLASIIRHLDDYV